MNDKKKKNRSTQAPRQGGFKQYGYMVGHKLYKSYSTAAADAAGGGATSVYELHTGKYWPIHRA